MIEDRRQTPVSVRDRRKSLRFKLNATAIVHEGPATAPLRKMVVSDVSETGVRLEGCIRLDLRRLYPVEFQLPSGSTISGEARIVWRKAEPYVETYGAEWTGLSWWQRRRLESGLRSLGGAPRASGPEVNWGNVAMLLALGAAFVSAMCLFVLK